MNTLGPSVRFNGWTLLRQSGELIRGEHRLRLQEQPLQVLVALLEQPGEVVSREALIARLWPKGVIDFDMGLNTAVRKLRAALEDDPDQPRFIETIPRRGYRFVGQIEASRQSQPETSSTPPPAEPTASRDNRRSTIRLAANAAAVVLVALAGWVFMGDRLRSDKLLDVDSTTPLPGRSVAVLPFVDRSTHQGDEFLAFGMAENILHQLAGQQQLTVIARTSSFALPGSGLDSREIGRRLNARFLLEGSVQRDGDHMRVTAQLIDATTGGHIWSIKFDRSVAAIFAVQDEIASKVADAMQLTLQATAEQRRSGRGTENVDAYLEYLRGRKLLATLRAEDVRQAGEHFQRAALLDPDFSSAYSSWARAVIESLSFRTSDQAELQAPPVWADARQLAERALTRDSANADAYEVLAQIDEDIGRAERYARRAIELEPNSASAHHRLSIVLIDKMVVTGVNTTPERLTHISRAIELDPLEPLYPTKKAVLYLYQRTGEFKQVEPLLQRALSLDPNYFVALLRLGEIRYCCEHRNAEGIKLAEQALRIDPASTWVRNFLIHMYLDVDDVAAAESLVDPDPASMSHQRIHVYRHDWERATKPLYSGRNGQAEPDYFVFSIVMQARQSGQHERAIEYLEQVTRAAGDSGVCPGVPLFNDCYVPVALGQLYQLTGRHDQAKALLERALELMDVASQRHERGELWFSLTRVRALALLGRREEALKQLQELRRSGMRSHWRELEVDPAMDIVRNDLRFVEFMKDMAAHAANQRTQVVSMRTAGLIPMRPAPKRE